MKRIQPLEATDAFTHDEDTWRLGPSFIIGTVSWTIGRDEPHVWLAATNVPPELLARAATLLDRDLEDARSVFETQRTRRDLR